MRINKTIKHYGKGENGVIVFFVGKFRYHRYYYAAVQKIAERGYLVLTIPYGYKKPLDGIKNTFNHLGLGEVDNIILMSHSEGDKYVYSFMRNSGFNISKLIVISPSRTAFHLSITPTLVMWSNRYKWRKAYHIFSFMKKRTNYKFIGYPNVSRYIFGGVGYSQYHDLYDKKPKKTFFDIDKYYYVDEDVIDDINLFIDEGIVKEKLAIFSENYLPFNSGVNILTNVLKVELEKIGKKVYPVSGKLKGVDYESFTQEKNVVAIKAFRLPGKKAKKEALVGSFRFFHNLKMLRPYQFNYIQMQTEFTFGMTSLMLRKRDNIPMVYTAHTMWNDMMNKRFHKIISKPFNAFLNKFILTPPLKKCSLMTVPTQKVKTLYINNWKQKEPIVVIPGCVDGKKFILSEEDKNTLHNIKESYDLMDKIVIGFVGRISREKSIDQVIDYFEKYALEEERLVLMLVGDGPDYDSIYERVKNSELADRIFMIGGVANTSLKYYYRLFDVFCTASTFETQGLTYIEAMWCHTPVLAREDECLNDFLFKDVNGVTFTDYESWKKGLNELINNKEYRNKITDAAYKTAEGYATDIWAKRMYYLYKSAKDIDEGKITDIDYQQFNKLKER